MAPIAIAVRHDFLPKLIYHRKGGVYLLQGDMGSRGGMGIIRHASVGLQKTIAENHFPNQGLQSEFVRFGVRDNTFRTDSRCNQSAT
jgi:hypothetical protein